MKKILFFLFLIPNLVLSATIATCENPEGHAYFPYAGMSPKDMAGWDKDKISNGKTQLDIIDGKFDIKFLDASKMMISAKEDDGDVFLYSISEKEIGVVVMYLGKAVEAYSFIKENDGKLIYTMVQSKANIFIPKASVMKGTCSYIDFDLALKQLK